MSLADAIEKGNAIKKNMESRSNEDVLKLIAECSLPFAIIESKTFRELSSKAYPGTSKVIFTKFARIKSE